MWILKCLLSQLQAPLTTVQVPLENITLNITHGQETLVELISREVPAHHGKKKKNMSWGALESMRGAVLLCPHPPSTLEVSWTVRQSRPGYLAIK